MTTIKEVFNGMTDKQKEIVQAMTAGEDNINPNHYKNETSLECIEAMQIAFGNYAVIHFCLCNAWKYIWRWKNKNGIEDLKKAEWYIEKGRELLGNNLDYYCTLYLQRFDSLADYINRNTGVKEHNNQPLYEEGDIVISKKGKIYLVFKECEGDLDDLIVADNAIAFESGIGTYISKDKIKRKVGNIKKENNI